ncbi:tachykinin-like peptides receptor 86C [Amphiura filiformis]|uniref:tachykinin-like peptides receptor 86C n=1 Tax=Amphiura filiformis TaxID=82378 RepID=UPI003B212C4D
MAVSNMVHVNDSDLYVSVNNTDSETYTYTFGLKQKVLLSVDIILFIIGFFGNGSIIYLTARHKGLRNIPNLMINNLAVGDMLVVIINISFNIFLYLLKSARQFLHQFCKYLMFVQFLSQGVSVLTLTALSVDRVIAVVYPLHKQRYARRISVWTVVAIWTASIAISCPIVAHFNKPCWFADDNSYTAYILCIVFLLFVLPSVVMMICYGLTAKELLHKKASLKTDSRAGRKQQKQRSRLALIVLIMTIIFILCSSLFYTWLVVLRFAPENAFVKNEFVKEAKSLLLKLNSVVNPVILYLMSSKYRRYLKGAKTLHSHATTTAGTQSIRVSTNQLALNYVKNNNTS